MDRPSFAKPRSRIAQARTGPGPSLYVQQGFLFSPLLLIFHFSAPPPRGSQPCRRAGAGPYVWSRLRLFFHFCFFSLLEPPSGVPRPAARPGGPAARSGLCLESASLIFSQEIVSFIFLTSMEMEHWGRNRVMWILVASQTKPRVDKNSTF